MGWKQEYQGILQDLKHCHWEDYNEKDFNEIARDLRRTIKRVGRVDYALFPPTFRWHLCSARLSQGKFTNWDGWEFRSNWSITFQGWNGFKTPIPKWNGRPVEKLVIASEQGIGDEILYGSAIPELMVRLGPKALDLQCHPRLIPIFERSYGIKAVPRLNLSEITDGDAIVALADLFMFYRRDKSHFPKKPFLVPNPVLREKWLKWLEHFPKPWIGVAWKSRHGEVSLEQLTESLDGTLVNMQYGEFNPDLIEPFCNPLEDMDDHIALVSCLDRVVSVTQTLVHEAGAIGVPCDAIKPPKGTGETDAALWYYGVGKSPHGHLVYGSVNVYESLDEYLCRHSTKSTTKSKTCAAS